MKLNYTKYLYIIVFILLLGSPLKAQNNNNSIWLTSTIKQAPKREIRAVWLTTIGGLDWPHSYAQSATSIAKQQKELIGILDQLKHAGINTVLFQTRIRGTVIYPSAHEPWDGCTSGFPGKSPGYDPLAFAIQACHDRGMEIQAWVVSIPMGKWTQLGCRSFAKKHPNLLKKIGDEGFLNPEKEGTAEYLATLCAEITKNYDIDGIHLDYIRYPETWNINVSKPIARAYITNIVKAVHAKVNALKPWVKLSCSPIGKHNDLSRYRSNGWNAYDRVAQDAQQWLKDGIMDELYPMMYFKDNNYYPFVFDWKENNSGKNIASGLGIYFMDPKEKNWDISVITRQLQVLRSENVGYAFFRNKFLLDNLKGLYTFIANDFNITPALTPAQHWKNVAQPLPPTSIKIDSINGILKWNEAPKTNNSPYLLYNVYADISAPINTNDASKLVKMRIRANELAISTKENLCYAITTIDRYGNESQAIQTHSYKKRASEPQEPMLNIKGSTLILPKEWVGKIEFVAIETLQGNIIATRPINKNTIDISGVNEGVYVLKTLHKKKKSLPIGYFLISLKP